MQTSTCTLLSSGANCGISAVAVHTDWCRGMPGTVQETVLLLEADAGGLADAARVLDFALHEARELLRRHVDPVRAEVGEALAHVGLGGGARDIPRDPADHLRRRACGSPEAVPEGELEARQRLGDGRY